MPGLLNPLEDLLGVTEGVKYMFETGLPKQKKKNSTYKFQVFGVQEVNTVFALDTGVNRAIDGGIH